jgi:hypothetical protein
MSTLRFWLQPFLNSRGLRRRAIGSSAIASSSATSPDTRRNNSLAGLTGRAARRAALPDNVRLLQIVFDFIWSAM